MSEYEKFLIYFAAATFALAFVASNYRGMIWVAALVLDLVLSDLYVRSQLPYPEVAMALLDFTVVASIYRYGLRSWEMMFYLIFQLSILLSLMALGAHIWAPGWLDDGLYLLGLELCNWLALLLVFFVSGRIYAGHFDRVFFARWPRILAFVHPLYREAATAKGAEG